jgi:hypothetical protein
LANKRGSEFWGKSRSGRELHPAAISLFQRGRNFIKKLVFGAGFGFPTPPFGRFLYKIAACVFKLFLSLRDFLKSADRISILDDRLILPADLEILFLRAHEKFAPRFHLSNAFCPIGLIRDRQTAYSANF